ncbi:hypothetical protein [Chenggangzhangella methanolivorans]|uniref:hypothetical protein n=1 Tax=Chenggangzhangella methanolivorans TaxID=1437009 RepID=UPI0021BD9B67|nr:hypothetical protein [Chenggangzhangella methanolivorans]
MSDAHTIHQSEAPSRRPPAGETTTAKHEVQAKQAPTSRAECPWCCSSAPSARRWRCG